MVVVFVKHDHLDRRISECFGQCDAPESASDNDYARLIQIWYIDFHNRFRWYTALYPFYGLGVA
jgi:hypothetical protein